MKWMIRFQMVVIFAMVICMRLANDDELQFHFFPFNIALCGGLSVLTHYTRNVHDFVLILN